MIKVIINESFSTRNTALKASIENEAINRKLNFAIKNTDDLAEFTKALFDNAGDVQAIKVEVKTKDKSYKLIGIW